MTREHEHDAVFGPSFASYDKEDMLRRIGNFAQRFEANKVDAKNMFSGKRCLDAGCGSGNGSLYMLQNGAATAEGIDISSQNIATATKNSKMFGFENASFQLGSCETLPFENESFDVVWSYGVVHHTAHPDACLRELSRVLRVGGQAFIFLYGAGGIFWYSCYKFRNILEGVPTDYCRRVLEYLDSPKELIASCMDDFKVPYLRTYRHEDIEPRLVELGFDPTPPWARGLIWDTNERRTVHEGDALWMGGGDLRYVLTKSHPAADTDNHPISEDAFGSTPDYDPQIVTRFDPDFHALGAQVLGNKLAAVTACRGLFDKIAELLRAEAPFDAEAYAAKMKETLALVGVRS